MDKLKSVSKYLIQGNCQQIEDMHTLFMWVAAMPITKKCTKSFL